MIVKVQLPIAGEPLVLVYNEERSLFLQFPVTKEIKKHARGDVRYFCEAQINPVTQTLELGARVGEQGW